VLWNSKNLTKTPDKTRCSGTVRTSLKVPGFIWCFSEVLTVPEYLVLSGVLVRFLLFQSTLTKTPEKTRYSGTVRISLKHQKKSKYSGTVRISLKHQIKPGALER
jgi:hypothetical protein